MFNYVHLVRVRIGRVGLKAKEPGIALGLAHLFSGDVVRCKSPWQRVFGKGNLMGAYNVHLVVCCVATKEENAIVL